MSLRAPAVFLSHGAVALAVGWAAPASAQTIIDPTVTYSSHTTGLSQPTQIRFLGSTNAQAFVTEKETGRVKLVTPGNTTGGTTVLDLNVDSDSERGLLGIALHPSFATNNRVYLYYSASTSTTADTVGSWSDNRLERYLWNGTNLTKDTTFLPASSNRMTFGTSADGQAQGPNHDGGPITFGPDGKLYGITGDLNRNLAERNNQASPNSSMQSGGVYRLNDDGSIPSDNPFVANANPDFRKWFAYGVRNSYGMNFDPANGRLWDTENGPGSYDEVNVVGPGFNSGWDSIMGPDSRSSGNASSDLVNFTNAVYSDPEFSYLNPVAVTGIEFLQGSVMQGAYGDAVLVAAAGGSGGGSGDIFLYRLNAARDGLDLADLAASVDDLVADDSTERNLDRWGTGFGALTDLQVGPDGALYAVSLGNGRIYRIVPEPTALAGLAVAGFTALRRGRRCVR